MMDNLSAFIIAAGVTAGLIIILRPLAVRIGLVDNPGTRKQHRGSIALVGGIAMFCGVVFASLSLDASLAGFRAFFAAATLLIIVGILDDFHELPPWAQFVAQLAAVLIMVFWGGVVVTDLGELTGGQSVVLGLWAIPFTLFASIGVINATNMSDGVDGLAGGLSFIAFVLLGVIALSGGREVDGYLLFLFATVVGIFLLFNFRHPWRRRAAVFMGDAGSMFLGFALAWFAISLSQGESRVMTPVTALWILALPLIDAVGILVRRPLRGSSPFVGARDHIHHVLLESGYGVNGTVGAVLALSAVLGIFGLLGWFYNVTEFVLFFGFIGLFLLHFWIIALLKASARKVRGTSSI
jgi:UDP-GlcNAc:undecaprenyl-phosphate/decaprenyl-phosphate GlcNAc-1-phosphate transferase